MDVIFAIVVVVQLFNISSSFSLEIELFKQSLRYYSYHGYNYVNNYIKKWFSKKEPEPPKVEKIKVERYEDKYKEKFQKMENNELDKARLEELKHNILMEMTPNGNVIMFYDFTNDSFGYYSDKMMPYRFLDAVGRKYVIQFRCKSIYVNPKDEKPEPAKPRKINIENSNRYVYLGKIVNFSFLQKVKKGVTNKKLIMSFKDFKNMNL